MLALVLPRFMLFRGPEMPQVDFRLVYLPESGICCQRK